MSESLLLETYEGQAVAAAAAIRREQDQAEASPEKLRVLQESIFLCLRFPDNVRDVVELELKAIEEDAGEGAARAVAMRTLIERSISLYRDLAEITVGLLRDLEAKGHRFRRSEKLPLAVKTLNEQAVWIQENWPVCSAGELEEAREQIRRGEATDVEEAFARLNGGTVEEWRRQVRQHPA